MTTIRPATPADDAVLGRIAAEGDADAPPAYLALVRHVGELLVAERSGDVVAFGGVIPVNDVSMVTDLFVAGRARGKGVGGELLGRLLAGNERRMTCSSKHPAALPAYERAGMRPRGLVHYWRGHATGGGPPIQPGQWQHDRSDLVQWFAANDAVLTEDSVVHLAADGTATIHRVVSSDAVATVAALLRRLPAGTEVTLCVPEWQPLSQWLASNAFDTFDHDLWCCTEGVDADPRLAVVHPGLW